MLYLVLVVHMGVFGRATVQHIGYFLTTYLGRTPILHIRGLYEKHR